MAKANVTRKATKSNRPITPADPLWARVVATITNPETRAAIPRQPLMVAALERSPVPDPAPINHKEPPTPGQVRTAGMLVWEMTYAMRSMITLSRHLADCSDFQERDYLARAVRHVAESVGHRGDEALTLLGRDSEQVGFIDGHASAATDHD